MGICCDQNGQPVFPPVGLQDNQIDKIQRELLAYCNLIQPTYFPLLQHEKINDRNVIILWAPGGENRPYRAPDSVTAKVKTYSYYIRRYSGTVEAKGEQRLELLSLTAKVPFDDRLNQSARVEDLSRSLMTGLLQEIGSKLADQAPSMSLVDLGRQMNVVGGSTESPYPKNVGLLFFNDAPDKFFPGTQIDVLYFPEGAGGGSFEEKIFKGPLGSIVREALAFIERTYLREVVVKHRDRAEATRASNFPFDAVEEALVNAVYHRSYEQPEPIEVRIDPSELVILSYPGPDLSISLPDFHAGRVISRRYRNRRIGEFLKELRLTEGRATGIPKIKKSMEINGSPASQFETNEHRVSYTIRLPVHPMAVRPAGEVTAEVTAEVARLLEVIHGEMSRKDIMSALDLKHGEHFCNAYLQPALRTNLITMTIPDSPTSRLQRYRLTTAGERWRSSPES